MSVACHIAYVLAGFGIVCDGSGGDIDILVFAVAAMRTAFRAISAVSSEHMAFISEMEKGPVVMVASEIDIASPSSVSAVGATIGLVLRTVHMHRASSAFA